jgi:Flp pilus assembly protein TadD
MGDLTKAKVDYEEAVRLSPSAVIYRNDLGGIYVMLGMMDRARAEFREILRIDPENDFARKNLSLIGEDK